MRASLVVVNVGSGNGYIRARIQPWAPGFFEHRAYCARDELTLTVAVAVALTLTLIGILAPCQRLLEHVNTLWDVTLAVLGGTVRVGLVQG